MTHEMSYFPFITVAIVMCALRILAWLVEWAEAEFRQ